MKAKHRTIRKVKMEFDQSEFDAIRSAIYQGINSKQLTPHDEVVAREFVDILIAED